MRRPNTASNKFFARKQALLGFFVLLFGSDVVACGMLPSVDDSLNIYIPNVFTPNFDGVNDHFSITINVPLKCTLILMNRWGEEISYYEGQVTAGTTAIWLGADMTEGTYYYHILFTASDETPLFMQTNGELPTERTGFVEIRK